MKWHKITVYAILFALCVNFIARSYEKSDLHVHCWDTNNLVHICNNGDDSEPLRYVRVLTTKTELQFTELISETICEIEPDIPENYKNVVVEPKNRVQEPRRIVDEDVKRTFVL